jgi:hypothetical protein
MRRSLWITEWPVMIHKAVCGTPVIHKGLTVPS